MLVELADRLFYPFQPCFGRAEETQRRIRALGAESRIIYDGNGVPGLNNVIGSSLLAPRLGREITNPDELTPLEKRLLNEFREGREPKILVVSDFDGVLVSPAHTAYEVVKGVLSGEIAVKDMVNETRERGKMSLRTTLAFGRIIRASDLTVFWSSRFYLSDEVLKGPMGKFYGPFRGRISYFPFIDDDSVRRLEKFGKDKMVVMPNKPLESPGEELAVLINKINPDIAYYIGSSERDREAVEVMLNSHLYLAPKFVLFDAGHFFL